MSDPVLELQFSAGVDESTSDELIEPGRGWAELVNLRQLKRGAAEKRLGYRLFASDGLDATARRRLDGANQNDTAIGFTTRTAGRRLFMSGDTPCVIDGTYIDAFSPAADSWVSKSRVSEVTYRHLKAPSVGTSDPVEDVVFCNGVLVVSHLFVQGTNVSSVVCVLDADTQAVIRPSEAIDGATSGLVRTRLATYGTTIIAIVSDAAATDIRAWYLDCTSRTTIAAGWVSIGTLASDFSGVYMDVASLSNSFAFAYSNSGGGTSRITVKTLAPGPVFKTVDINTSSIDPEGISLSEDSSTLWVAWAEEVAGGPPTVTNFKVIGLDPANVSGTPLATAATVISTSRATGQGAGRTWVVDTGSGTGVLYAINENVFNTDGIVFRPFHTTAGAVTGPASPGVTGYRLQNCVPVGRPLYRGGRVYIPLSSSNLEEIVLCDCTDQASSWRPVAVPVQRGVYNLLSSVPRVRVAATGTNTYVHAFNILKAGSADNGINGTALVEYSFADPERWHVAQLSNSTFIGGGVTSVFDGRRVYEAGFLCRPAAPDVDTASSGSQTFSAGRSYVATYEEVDCNGDWHVSGVSNPTPTGVIASKKVVVEVKPLSITARREEAFAAFGATLRIGIWGTTDGGSTYYRMTSLENIAGSELISWEDTLTEDEFTSNTLLYATGNLPGTNGSSQDHRAPPGLKYLVSYAGMVVGATGNAIYYSSQPIDGEGTWFSPVFVQYIDEDVSGIAVQDGSVIVFTKTGAWSGAGDPPSDNAFSGGLGTFRKLSIDVGCIDANSIVTTSMGTFFQSTRGIELLTRGGSILWAGEKIQNTLEAYPVVSSATFDTAIGLVRFSLAESRTDGVISGNGRDICFDLTGGTWTVDDKRGGSASQTSQDACMLTVDGESRYAWLATGGSVFIEKGAADSDAHLDVTSWMTMRAVTPWVAISGRNGEQFIDQVLLLAKRQTAHDLIISIAHDFSESYTSSRTFSAATVASLAREWLSKEVTQTTSQAIRVKLEDATPSSGTVGSGRGASWICLSLNGQPHRGPKRTSAAQRGA